jgi:phage terminase small subunit
MLNERQKRFCDEYLVDLNATQAAKRAGYSAKTSYSQGHDLLKHPEIKPYIEKRLEESAMSKTEALRLVSDIARGNLGDYFTPQIVKKRTLVTKALSTLIKELQKEIEFEIEFEALLPDTDKEKTKQKLLIQAKKRELLRMQLELKHNPKAKRIVEGPEELVEEMQLNINQVVADKVRGRIKAVTPSEHGVKVELYSAEAAQATILKIHGAFEKDNAQKKVEIPAPFSEEQVDKLISQLRKK